jgi:uncharacterized membrane protein YphA (DoxX/SURF4 family)
MLVGVTRDHSMFDVISLSAGNAATLLAAAAFLLGAIINASGSKAVRDEFVRYGFPSWWSWVTAILEFLTAVFLVLRPTFEMGVALGACIMVAAILAVVRTRDYRHIAPPSAFLLLLIIAALVPVSA